MAQTATFEEFLDAPSRIAKQEAKGELHSDDGDVHLERTARPPRAKKRSKTLVKKEKVGLTIHPEIIEAIDDYIYRERKQGRRLKKNDVYEAALRQFLGLGGGEAR